MGVASAAGKQGALVSLFVRNANHLELELSGRALHRDRVPPFFPKESPPDRRLPREPSCARIRLVGTDERVRAPLAVFVFDLDRRAEEDHVLSNLVFANDDGAVQPLGQEMDASINLAKALLPVDVLRILAAVTLSSGVSDLLNDPRALGFDETTELLCQALRTGRRDVVRGHRNERAKPMRRRLSAPHIAS